MKYPKAYREKSPTFKAMLITEENVPTVMKWIGVNISTNEYQRIKDTIIITSSLGEELLTEIGWWVVRDEDGNFTTCNQEYFESYYEEIYED